MAKKFKAKDSKYSKIPTSANPKSPNEPGEYQDHSYSNRELRPDGSTVYYYDNGVKAIHHPKKTGSTYHRRAADHHSKQSNRAADSKKTAEALSHLKARMGHLLAAKEKEEGKSKVEKLYKDFGGADSGAGDVVAVASDPGIFTETYSGTDKKKSKKNKKDEVEENKKNKKKASGPDKLDKWLKDTEEKSLELFSFKKTDKKKFPLGRTGGLTPDNSIKTPLEERDMEEWMEARQKNAEDRAWGLKLSKTRQLGSYVADLINGVHKELKDDRNYNRPEGTTPEEEIEMRLRSEQEDYEENRRLGLIPDEDMEKMETGWSKNKKDGKLTNMPFLGMYKKSVEGRRENPPPQVEKQYGAKRSPNPDKNGYRNPPNRRIPDPEE
jgi:hypothetical protein